MRLLTVLAGVIACGDASTAPSDSYQGRFQELWDRYDSTYPYFVHKAIDWNAVHHIHLPRAQAAGSQDELVSALVDMLSALHDVHIWLVRPDGSTVSTYTSPRARNWERTTWLEYTARAGWNQQSGTSFGWGRFGEVGYLTIGDWNPARVSAAGLDMALESLRNAPALVIDVRMNGGGNDAIAMEFAGRFATSALTTEFFRFRGGPRHDDFTAPTARRLSPRGPWTFTAPVFLLIGRGVYSSNESFVAAMRELPQVTLVGDTTGGGTGNPALHPLGDGWQYTVPRWIATTVDGIVIEDNGIPPDLVLPVDRAAFERRVDVVLDSALVLARIAARRSPSLPNGWLP
jgi:C-terminal processing protease CtpA/Prc